MGRPTARHCGGCACERPSSGFTLVETLAAGLILTISAVAIGTAVSQDLRSLMAAREYARAAELLDRTMARVDVIGPARLLVGGPTEGPCDAPDERFSWSVAIEPRLAGSLYEVAVSVSWPTAGGSVRSVSARTLLNDPPGARSTELEWSDL